MHFCYLKRIKLAKTLKFVFQILNHHHHKNMKNIVIIGAQGGGAIAAQELKKTLPEDYRIVLIERQNFTYWSIGGLRAAVKPGK